MPKKKVYFYKVKCLDKKTMEEKEYCILDKEVEKIMASNTSDENSSTFILTEDKSVENIILDVLELNDKYLFGRMCKEKDYTELLKRDYKSLEVKAALEGEKDSVGLEVSSYFLLDFKKGVLCFCKSQSGPKNTDFTYLFSLYNKETIIKLENIPNKNAIDLIYKNKGTELINVELEIPTPSYEFFEEVVYEENEISKEEKRIIKKIQEGSDRVYLKFTKEERAPLLSNSDDARSFIDIIRTRLDRFRKAKIRGKSSKITSAQTFDLLSDYFSYEITVMYEEMTRSRRLRLPLDRIDSSYKNGILYAYYNQNIELITELINR